MVLATELIVFESLLFNTADEHIEDLSYMSAHVLLNLLNELGKSDEMRGLPSILSLFHEFDKFSNAGARILDSIYYMTLK